MDKSRRAVDAYWRVKMVEDVTADEDKVAPVYKLEEICGLLRSSHGSIVREVAECVIKRLDHRSPVVKQKALRLIKYAVGKSGTEFKREMQRNSTNVRQLCHYKGNPDPLKGDALNRAVRDTANETVSAIFASDESMVAPREDISSRIQGFGNKNFEKSSLQEKKSFLGMVVGVGSSSVRQGLGTCGGDDFSRSNNNWSYSSQRSERSSTLEHGNGDRYETKNKIGSWNSKEERSANLQTPDPDSILHVGRDSSTKGDTVPRQSIGKSREERLLETIVTSGGVRLQPTRDAVQVFLTEASKMNQVSMCHALETKLQSNLWQVRLRAICILDSILRKNDELSATATYFRENIDSIVKCVESPQASLREKASKVMNLLKVEVVEQASEKTTSIVQESIAKSKTASTSLPDLIDTSDSNDQRNDVPVEVHIPADRPNATSTGSLVDVIFGSTTKMKSKDNSNEEDPFADVAFHVSEEKDHVGDLSSGLTIDDRRPGDVIGKQASTHFVGIYDSPSSGPSQLEDAQKNVNVHGLMSEIPVSVIPEQIKKTTTVGEGLSCHVSSTSSFVPNLLSQCARNEALTAVAESQVGGVNPNTDGYRTAPSPVLNQTCYSQHLNYGNMSSVIAQQQMLYQNLGNLNIGTSHSFNNADGSYKLPLPDIFQLSKNSLQLHDASTKFPEKEDSKAFDFISDHVEAARSTKRVVL